MLRLRLHRAYNPHADSERSTFMVPYSAAEEGISVIRTRSIRQGFALVLCVALEFSGISFGQERTGAAGSVPKYKLTIVEGASTSKRAKKGRVSSEAVVKITDENDVPVPGIAVSFAIPQLGGATFADGTLTSVVTTNAAGVASSGSFSATTGSSFSMSVTASTPGGALTSAVPVTTAAAAAGAGISTGALVGILAGVGAAAAVGIAVAMKGKGTNPPPPVPQGTIGLPGTPSVGAQVP
jgi:hypothetical protein